MSRIKSIIFFYLSVAFLLQGCEEKTNITETPSNVIGKTPSIELIEVTPLTIKQFEGTLKFTINYTDGNGDIGFEDADEKSVEITDERAGLTHLYHVPPVAPQDTEITITGTLVVELDNIILIDQEKSSEEAIFSVRLKDRAGNWSNKAASSTVTVVK